MSQLAAAKLSLTSALSVTNRIERRVKNLNKRIKGGITWQENLLSMAQNIQIPVPM